MNKIKAYRIYNKPIRLFSIYAYKEKIQRNGNSNSFSFITLDVDKDHHL